MFSSFLSPVPHFDTSFQRNGVRFLVFFEGFKRILCILLVVLGWSQGSIGLGQANQTPEAAIALTEATVAPTEATGAPTTFSSEELQRILKQLESSEFATRESASEKLSKCDDSMLPSLERAALGLTDLEAKIRLGGILTKLKQDRIRFQMRSFIRSTDTSETFGFDGWKSFSKVGGTNRSAKLLFLELLELYPDLVEKELASKEEAYARAKAVASKIDENDGQLQSSQIADGLALLYCINVADDLFEKSMGRITLRTFRTSPFGPFLSMETQYRKSLEPMMSKWAFGMQDRKLDCMLLFLEKDLRQAKDLALLLLETIDVKQDPYIFLLCMQAIYRFGVKEDVPRLSKWLKDETVCFAIEAQVFPDIKPEDAQRQLEPGRFALKTETFTAEFRDAALLVSMHLSGADTSMEFPNLQLHPLRGFRDETISLPKDASKLRTDRIERWLKRP